MRIADTLIIDILNAHSGIELSQCHVCLRVAIVTAVLWLFSRCPLDPIGMLSLRWMAPVRVVGDNWKATCRGLAEGFAVF